MRAKIALRVKSARIMSGRSITQAAKDAKITRFQWSRLETAQVSIPAEFLPTIAKVVDVDPADLLPKAA